MGAAGLSRLADRLQSDVAEPKERVCARVSDSQCLALAPSNRQGQLTRACVELAKAWRMDKFLRRLDVRRLSHWNALSVFMLNAISQP